MFLSFSLSLISSLPLHTPTHRTPQRERELDKRTLAAAQQQLRERERALDARAADADRLVAETKV